MASFKLKARFSRGRSETTARVHKVEKGLTKTVAAVVFSITSEGAGNAPARGTPEIGRGASGSGAILVFIRVVQAVVVSVANPSLGNASLVVAREIPGIRASLNWWLSRRVRRASLSITSQPLTIGTPTTENGKRGDEQAVNNYYILLMHT